MNRVFGNGIAAFIDYIIASIAEMRGIAWFDDNADSVRDDAENPLSEIYVSLLLNGQEIMQTNTNLSGQYVFDDLDLEQCYTAQFMSPDANIQIGAIGMDNDSSEEGQTGPICLTADQPNIPDIDVYIAKRLFRKS